MEDRKKLCEGTDREFKIAVREKKIFGKGLYVINYMKILEIQGIICHGKFAHAIIKPNTGGQFDYVGINNIVEHIFSGTQIIQKTRHPKLHS